MGPEERKLGLNKLRRRSIAAKVAIGAFLIAIFFTIAAIQAANLGYVYDADVPSLGITRYELIDACYLVSLYGSYVVVALWIWQAHRNIHDAGFGPLEFTPGWAVGWFAVPVATLWKPFQAMREVWNVSVSGDAENTADAHPLLWTWWITWILGNMLSLAAAEANFWIALSILDVVSAVALWIIIERITLAQHSTSLAEFFD